MTKTSMKIHGTGEKQKSIKFPLEVFTNWSIDLADSGSLMLNQIKNSFHFISYIWRLVSNKIQSNIHQILKWNNVNYYCSF